MSQRRVPITISSPDSTDFSALNRLTDEIRGRNRVLESLAKGESLATVLSLLIEETEDARPGMIASVLVLDQQAGCFRHGASRNLPADFCEAIDGVMPGPSVGSCGTAVFTGQRVIVEDIHTNPLWEDYRDAAIEAGLRACWSEPILASCGRVIGTFAMYYREPRTPDEEDLEFVKNAAKVASLAIERVRADNVLRQMAAIVDSTEDAIFLKNNQGIIEKWNLGAERVYGYTSDEAVGQSVTMLIPEDRLYERNANLERLRQGERLDHFETIRLTKDGRRIYVSTTISPIHDSEGKLSHFVEVQNEITRRVQAQAELDRERSVLEAIVHGIPDAMLLANLDRKFTFCNEGACRMFGYETGEMEGQSAEILYAEQDDFRRQGQVRFNPTSIPQDKIVEMQWRRKNGEVFTGEILGTIIRDSHGKPINFLAIIRDISDRKLAEANIHESNRKLSTLLSNLPGAAFRIAVDADFTTEFISDGCLEMTGYSPSEITTGKMLVHPDDFDETSKRVFSSVAERRPFDFVHRALHRNGAILELWTRGQGVYSDAGELIAVEGYLSDITDLQDARNRLVQSERLAAVGQMISAIAHESRNALQRIQIGVDMLSFDITEDADSHKDLRRITKAKNDLQHLLDELRSYAAPIQLDASVCSLADIWRSAWESLEHACEGRQASLNEQIGDAKVIGEFDAFRLEQVFRNLFENSLAACSDPVEITVDCQQVIHEGTPRLRVGVQDNGPGLSPEQQERIFEAFYTTKTKGSGLGMAIASRIIQAHCGTISAGSASDSGASFVIELPSEPL